MHFVFVGKPVKNGEQSIKEDHDFDGGNILQAVLYFSELASRNRYFAMAGK